jgi:hypothetical protein
MMDDDLRQLDGVLRDRAAEVPQVQDVPPKMLARARRRVARNAVVFVLGAAAIVVGAPASRSQAIRGARLLRPCVRPRTCEPRPHSEGRWDRWKARSG